MASLARIPRAAWVAAILALTFACFSPALRGEKEFTNWDDNEYVSQPPLGASFEDDVATIFRPSTIVVLNYHPVTVLSLAVNRRLARDDVRAYALTNVLLHLVNTLLVFFFIHRLSGRRFWVGAIAALLFGIHPMHVESVAWISGRKDLVYCAFFVGACLAYLVYLETRRPQYLVLTFVAFVLSCLSKAMAVPLPGVLLLLDWFHRRRLHAAALLEKVPFVLVSLWIGVLAVRIQATVRIGDFTAFTPLDRLCLASYGFVMYWVKLFVPVGLSSYYPYPVVEGGRLPWPYPAMPVIALLVVAVPPWLARRWGADAFRTTVFGIAFFAMTVALVLQIVSVGGAVMADRYTYVAYVAPLFMLVALASGLVTTEPRRRVAIAGVAVATAVLAVTSYRRTEVWTNSDTLWSDVIAKYPLRTETVGDSVKRVERGVVTAYQNRGNYYLAHGRVDDAARDYQLLVDARVAESGPYINMGSIHTERARALLAAGDATAAQAEFATALRLYATALAHGDNEFDAYMNRGITYAAMGQDAQALEDFRNASTRKPGDLNALVNVAREELQLHRYPECIADATKVIDADPMRPNAHLIRGMAYLNSGRRDLALADLQRAVTLDPKLGVGWFGLSMCYAQSGNLVGALDAARRARQAGYPVTDAYLTELERNQAPGG